MKATSQEASTIPAKYTILPRPTVLPNVDDLVAEFHNLTLPLEAKLDRCEQLINQAMTTPAIQQAPPTPYQLNSTPPSYPSYPQQGPPQSYSPRANYVPAQENWQGRTSEYRANYGYSSEQESD